jgi:PAS domain S-box-containing protein
MTLQKAGYRVLATVATGAQAIAKAAELQPDLVLMDVTLAGELDGIETARRIRAQREVPIVYLTASGNPAILAQAKATEPIAFILKPFEEPELLATIEITWHRYQAQRQRTREALEESEARYRELFETARDGIAITDLASLHLDCNSAYCRLLGYACPDDLRLWPLIDLTAPEYRQREGRILATEVLARGYSEEYEKECLRKDGARVVVSARIWLRRDRRGQPNGLWHIVRDVAERKEAERRILDYQHQLQSLMAELSLAEERERQRIATDIHDRISQTLAVCQMRLEALSQSISPPTTARQLEEVCLLLERTIRDTSSLVFELSPPLLHQLGLAPALEWYGEKLQEQHDLRVEIRQTAPPASLSADQRTVLFRAACELMNNVVKHARATSILISMGPAEGGLRLCVEDDGTGFAAEATAPWTRPRGGFGLFHIRERMRAWGGSLDLDSAPGRGTRAILTLPRTQTAHEH